MVTSAQKQVGESANMKRIIINKRAVLFDTKVGENSHQFLAVAVMANSKAAITIIIRHLNEN